MPSGTGGNGILYPYGENGGNGICPRTESPVDGTFARMVRRDQNESHRRWNC